MSEGLSNKEMLVRLLDQNEKALITQAQILKHSESVDEHLNRLNSKVATHEAALSNLSTEHTKFKAVTATLWVVAGMVWSGFTFLWK